VCVARACITSPHAPRTVVQAARQHRAWLRLLQLVANKSHPPSGWLILPLFVSQRPVQLGSSSLYPASKNVLLWIGACACLVVDCAQRISLTGMLRMEWWAAVAYAVHGGVLCTLVHSLARAFAIGCGAPCRAQVGNVLCTHQACMIKSRLRYCWHTKPDGTSFSPCDIIMVLSIKKRRSPESPMCMIQQCRSA
jgi:hypothetical protein